MISFFLEQRLTAQHFHFESWWASPLAHKQKEEGNSKEPEEELQEERGMGRVK